MKTLWKSAVAAIAICFSMLGAPVHAADRPDLVEIVSLSGEISSSTAESIASQLESIAANPKIKAVVLEVDSPGGGAIASAAIYEALSSVKVPVVAWCNNMCASGGVYAMMATSVKYIGLRSETISGSVGVIMHVQRYNRLLEWAKIDNEVYKSGSLKDAGNSARGKTEDETKYLQGIVDELAKRFYAVVDKARGKRISAASWDYIKTGRILIGKEAVERGLADAVMSRADAIQKAKELSGSKLIFTRDEIKKMSAIADQHPVYKAPLPAPSALSDLPWLVQQLKQIQAGETISFEYRMPFKF